VDDPTPASTAPAQQSGALYFCGLDLGQVQDYTALAVLERTLAPDPAKEDTEAAHYAVRHLERFPLGTAYTTICEHLKKLFSKPPLQHCTLAVDQTGVGRPVVDMIRRARLQARLFPISITAGHAVNRGEGGARMVPKKHLVGVLQVLLQARRLKISSALREAATLTKELQTFKVKVSLDTGNESFEAWRERDHDDLVLAVAIAAWQGERYKPWKLEIIGHPE
jgi:hypothetical protein